MSVGVGLNFICVFYDTIDDLIIRLADSSCEQRKSSAAC